MTNITPIIGTCLSMCPHNEIVWRERNKLLHKFEIQSGTESNPKADPDKVVKLFSRSAAGRPQQTPADLRPSEVLLKTMNYLTNVIIMVNEVPWVEIYDFINDRIQAIRQDITVQMIQDINTVEIYEKSVRFYIISSYVLCEEPQSKFDQHLNRKQLIICLEKVIDLYRRFPSDAMKEFVSIYLSLSMDDCEKFYRSEILFKNLIKDNFVKLTVRTCISWITGNFIRFFLCIQKLPIILQISFFSKFGFIRKETLKTLSVAFSSGACQFPREKLSSWLCLNDFDTDFLCKAYNVKTEAKKVLFNKKDFNFEAPILPIFKKECFIDFKTHDIPFLINATKNCSVYN